ncbi:MAG: hypothetical protein M0Z95_15790 [Actinomycetota bacterium]|jgi:hypothetical protein|nr:hypothetical protein [Actinomycetota bacterium]
MSDTSQGPGWWQAADGKWYAPEFHSDHGRSPATHADRVVGPTTPAPQGSPEQIPAHTPRRRTGKKWLVGVAVVIVVAAGAGVAVAVGSHNSPPQTAGDHTSNSITAQLKKDGITQAEETCAKEGVKGADALLKAGNGASQTAALLQIAGEYGLNSSMYGIIHRAWEIAYALEYRTGYVAAAASVIKSVVDTCTGHGLTSPSSSTTTTHTPAIYPFETATPALVAAVQGSLRAQHGTTDEALNGVTVTKKTNPTVPTWTYYAVQWPASLGTDTTSSTQQRPDDGFAHKVNGTWTIVTGPTTCNHSPLRKAFEQLG